MMHYDNPNIRDLIAAEYVFGTLRGAARARFLRLVATRADWQKSLSQVTNRVHLLADTLPAVTPHPRVWQQIQTKLHGVPSTATSKGGKDWLGWWRALAISASSIAAILATLLIYHATLRLESPLDNSPIMSAPINMALLSAPDTTPGWIIALADDKDGQLHLKITTLASLKRADTNTFELWLLPTDQSAPISLGLMPQQGNKQLVVNEVSVNLLLQSGLAVSLEPMGGSPIGQPTGAVLYQGRFTEI
jgi:anti-sigma-K factor RskA